VATLTTSLTIRPGANERNLKLTGGDQAISPEQRPELRTEFLAAIDDAMDRVVRLARHLGSSPGIDPALGVKRVFVKRCRFTTGGASRRAAKAMTRATASASGTSGDRRPMTP
jgi:hypothetical protein